MLSNFTANTSIFPAYRIPLGKNEGDGDAGASGAKKPKKVSVAADAHSPSLMRTFSIPGDAFKGPSVMPQPNKESFANRLVKIVKQNPGLTELRLGFDPVTHETGVQKIGDIDGSKPSPVITLTPEKSIGARFKVGEPYQLFSEGSGINEFIGDFVDQNMTRVDDHEAQMAGYVEGNKDKSVNPFTKDYKFVFSNPEPGVLEIEIADA